MATRVIPKKIKVKMEFYKGITLGDILFALAGIAIAVAIFTANFMFHEWVALAWASVVITLLMPIADGMRLYATIIYLFRFFAQKTTFTKGQIQESKNQAAQEGDKGKKAKKDSGIGNIIPFDGIVNDKFIDFKEYYAQVIEISPIEFGLLNEYKQEMVIETFANAIRRTNDMQTINIVKLSKAMILDSYSHNEDKKYDALMDLQAHGEMTDEEVQCRSGVFEGRIAYIDGLNRREKVFKDYYYMVVYGKDKESLDTTGEGIVSTFGRAVTPINARRLTGKDLVVFLKANYGKDFDERELELVPMSQFGYWCMPEKIKFRAAGFSIDGHPYRQFVVSDYPLTVNNAWLFRIFAQDSCRINMKIKPIKRDIAERTIDKAIMEMESKSYGKSSKRIENETHMQTLRDLLASLKNNNQQLYDVNIFLTCEEAAKKEVRAILKQEGFKYSEMFGRQVDAFISSSLSMRDNIKETQRGIPTSTIAAGFPFISGALQDPDGFYIGENEYPVFVNFFLRNKERVNSNMMIIGKSGSGKSFCTKTLLTNLAADHTKIFILDPEDEYTTLAKKLHGKVIDVGSSKMGIINPFHIMTTLDDEDEPLGMTEAEKEALKNNPGAQQAGSDSFAVHLQFLEQFFRVILEGMDSDSFEALNSLVVEVYNEKGIDEKTHILSLTADQFPIFDDLYRKICEKVDNETNDYYKRIYMTIQTYVKKFASGGRNSNLWNGPTSIATKENFVTFNFRSLLANKNQVIANAQMLLIFKYLDNEIIKNRDFNLKYHADGGLKDNRKIIVAVDEAHVFINPNFPVALDFMAQMAKRIRKYSGMQIVITQNIKDFVGTPEIQRQSTAIINASQYSLIFSLAPNDITDLVELYSKAGEINQEEQNTIVTAGVGQCFLISGAMSRTSVQINALACTKNLFSNQD